MKGGCLLVVLAACSREPTTHVSVTRTSALAPTTHASASSRPPRSASHVAGMATASLPECPTNMSEMFFFPQGTFGPTEGRFDQDEFRRTWYSKHLRAMNEPSLSCGDTNGDSYRFLWLRTFHAPIAVRIDRTPEKSTISAVQLSGAGGYDPGSIADRTTRDLSAQNVDSLLAAFDTADFWHLPSWKTSMGADGAQWIVEARSRGQYHVVDRWSPKAGPFQDLANRFLSLARFQIPSRDAY